MADEKLIVPRDELVLINQASRRFAANPTDKTREDLQIAIADLASYAPSPAPADPVVVEPEPEPEPAEESESAPELDLEE